MRGYIGRLHPAATPCRCVLRLSWFPFILTFLPVYDPDPEQLDLSLLTCLRKFEVWLEHDDEEGITFSAFSWLYKLLRTFSPANKRVEEITMQVKYLLGPLDLDPTHWKDVVDVLLSPRFPALKKINIVVNYTNNLPGCTRAVGELNTSDHIRRLRSRQGLEVDVTIYVGGQYFLNIHPENY